MIFSFLASSAKWCPQLYPCDTPPVAGSVPSKFSTTSSKVRFYVDHDPKLGCCFFLGLITFFIPESWKQKDVKGQVILITGAGSGIGQLQAIKFLQLGAKVVIWDVSQEGIDKTLQMMRDDQLDVSQVFSYKINLCERNSIYETAKRVKEDVGTVDILINNAGVVSGKNFLDIPDEKIELTLKVNTLAHFWTVKAFLPDMVKKNSGHIVTVASVAGNLAGCAMSDYHASKFANVGFDLSLS